MSVADRLLRRLEANINQSLGVRPGGESDSGRPGRGPEAGPRPPGPNDGRTRSRSAGLMDIRNVVPDPDQPRKAFDEDAVRRLAESLKRFGQLMPIRVRWD